MSDDEVEYEVESILSAKIEKKRGKKKGLVWKYKVRWKGYKPEDDTWEPEESFAGSDDILRRFWERAKTGGRDHNDINLFNAGEEFLPVGPPRRKRKKAPSKERSAEPEPLRSPHEERASLPPEKRRRVERNSSGKAQHKAKDGLNHQASPQKQLNKAPSTPSPIRSPRKSARKPSVENEIIPASDEEMDQLPQTDPPVTLPDVAHVPQKEKAISSPREYVLLDDGDEVEPAPTNGHASSSTTVPPPALPFHQHRAANPLVKLVKDPLPTDMGNAIAAKVRLMGTADKSPSNSPKRNRGFISTKPIGLLNKNKSSLLTFDKGELKSVKGSFRTPEAKLQSSEAKEGSTSDYGSLFGDDMAANEIDLALQPEVPPTAQELLKLAGADSDAEIDELEEFEDDPPPAPVATNSEHVAPLDGALDATTEANATSTSGASEPAMEANNTTTFQQSFPSQHNLELLFPARNGTPTSATTNAWATSTIFGPLVTGFNSRSRVASQTLNELTQVPMLSLNLDPTLTLPIALNRSYPSNSPSALSVTHEKGPPGKFYASKATGQLLDSLRTGGFSAQVALDVTANEAQQACFNQFVSRLKGGDICIAMLGSAVLAFCSSENALAIQRLNIHPSLISSPTGLLVSQVVIENYSVYADAALTAEDWLSL